MIVCETSRVREKQSCDCAPGLRGAADVATGLSLRRRDRYHYDDVDDDDKVVTLPRLARGKSERHATESVSPLGEEEVGACPFLACT